MPFSSLFCILNLFVSSSNIAVSSSSFWLLTNLNLALCSFSFYTNCLSMSEVSLSKGRVGGFDFERYSLKATFGEICVQVLWKLLMSLNNLRSEFATMEYLSGEFGSFCKVVIKGFLVRDGYFISDRVPSFRLMPDFELSNTIEV